MEIPEPEVTREELVEIVQSGQADKFPIFMSTNAVKDKMKRAYLSDKFDAKDLAFMFQSDEKTVKAFIKKEGWNLELDKSRTDGELAQQKAEVAAEVFRIKQRLLSAVGKGVETLMREEYTGDMVVENAVKLRAIGQTLKDLDPTETKQGSTPQPLINLGVQVN